jgi:hypothetical protein
LLLLLIRRRLSGSLSGSLSGRLSRPFRINHLHGEPRKDVRPVPEIVRRGEEVGVADAVQRHVLDAGHVEGPAPGQAPVK